PRDGWTVVLRRQPARIVNGQAEGPYTDAFEIICCQCGDDPRLPYPEVPPKLQLIRGPYPIVVGIVAYEEHLMLHDQPDAAYQPRGCPMPADQRQARVSATSTIGLPDAPTPHFRDHQRRSR